MLYETYQHLPQYINPIAFSIGSFLVRWYTISYLVGFTTVYLVLLWRIRRDEFKDIAQISNFQPALPAGRFSIYKQKEMRNVAFDLLLVAFFSALIGGRIGYVLFYNWTYFSSNPAMIISPYNSDGVFIGLYGMSYHGALIGIVLGSFLFLKIKKQNFFAWADFVVPAVALGYFFGRIGNFLNGELYGRMTDSILGMYFTADLNHLRHPSQLYEALLEGLLMFVILWKIRSASWRKKFKAGSFFSIYLFGYGLMRMLLEQFRQPDPQIGLLLGHFTLGQLFSLVMMIVGFLLLVSLSKKEK